MSLMPNQPVRRARAGYIIAAIVCGFGAAVPVGQGLAVQALALVAAVGLALAGLRAPASNPRDALDRIAKEREQGKFS